MARFHMELDTDSAISTISIKRFRIALPNLKNVSAWCSVNTANGENFKPPKYVYVYISCDCQIKNVKLCFINEELHINDI